jgi:hypothetical protein
MLRPRGSSYGETDVYRRQATGAVRPGWPSWFTGADALTPLARLRREVMPLRTVPL